MDPIIFSLSTVPERVKMFEQTIDSFFDQADQINIYLNNFDDIPSFLKRSKIDVWRSQDHGDRGDSGKFFLCEKEKGYYFTVDDDIIYPSDYAPILIDGVERYQQKYAVGVHASQICSPYSNYQTSRQVLHFEDELEKDTPVHLLGTGTLCFHTDTIHLKRFLFQIQNMADVLFSLYCQKEGIGLMALSRQQGWLKSYPYPLDKTLFGKNRNRAILNKMLAGHPQWTHHASI